MSVLLGAERLALWIQREIELPVTLKEGARGQAVRRIQEWLTFRGYGLAIDGDFGRVTKKRIHQFQEDQGLPASGMVTETTYQSLIAPLLQVLTPIQADSYSFPALVALYAKAHLAQQPLEVGGQNRGPWVRIYMKGLDGREFPWCAGFVSFILKQASETLHMSTPIQGSPSCDSLAAQGKDAGLLIKESDLSKGKSLHRIYPGQASFSSEGRALIGLIPGLQSLLIKILLKRLMATRMMKAAGKGMKSVADSVDLPKKISSFSEVTLQSRPEILETDPLPCSADGLPKDVLSFNNLLEPDGYPLNCCGEILRREGR